MLWKTIKYCFKIMFWLNIISWVTGLGSEK